MSKLRSLSLGVIAGGLALGPTAPSAHACSCHFPSQDEAFSDVNAVIAAEVISVSGCDPFYVATFQVFECWKGVVAEQISVGTERSGAACGVEFEVGTRGIFYLYADGPCDADFEQTICDRQTDIDSETERARLGPPATCFLSVEPTTWGRVKSSYVNSANQ